MEEIQSIDYSNLIRTYHGRKYLIAMVSTKNKWFDKIDAIIEYSRQEGTLYENESCGKEN